MEPGGVKGFPAARPQPKLLLLRHAEPTRRAAVTCEMALLKGSQLVVAHPELLLCLRQQGHALMQLGLQLSPLSGMSLAQLLLPCLQGELVGVVVESWQHLWPTSQTIELLLLPCSRFTRTRDLAMILGWSCAHGRPPL